MALEVVVQWAVHARWDPNPDPRFEDDEIVEAAGGRVRDARALWRGRMMRSKIWILLGLSFWVLIFGVARSDSSPAPDMVPSGSGAVVPTRVEWPVTEGAPGGGRYSPLAEIDRSNVAQLEIVWTYHHGDAWKGRFPLEINRGSAFESTPIVVDGRLFFTTPRNRVVALDPETGRELWTFDPQLETGRAYANRWINRGVAYWRDATSDAECSSRLFLATLDARLIALDARTGRPCGRFGREGSVDLAEGIAPLHDPWEYGSTSPPTVVGDRVVVGSSIADTIRPDAPSGEVRAFDARDGREDLDLPDDSAGRGARGRDLGRLAGSLGCRQCLVDDHGGPRTWTGLPSGQHRESRLLRR
jgi:hypothetical protein